MNNLPERINVMRVISYDVQDIVDSLVGTSLDNDVTLDDVLQVVEAWAEDDFGSLNGLIFQDENGEDL